MVLLGFGRREDVAPLEEDVVGFVAAGGLVGRAGQRVGVVVVMVKFAFLNGRSRSEVGLNTVCEKAVFLQF